MMESALEKIYSVYSAGEGNVITLLQEIQREFGYIPEDAVFWFSKKLDIPASRFFGVATFYAQFRLKPRGQNIISVCCGTACHVMGAGSLRGSVAAELSIPPGEETTSDRKFTVEKVNCIGACSIAPVVIINDKVHGKVTTKSLIKEIRRFGRTEGDAQP